jgi:putative redox protein
MKDSASIHYLKGMAFDANVNGHNMIIDATREFGGNNEGPGPKSLMMVSLAGCTGMDIVLMLNKMRIKFEDLTINVDGNVTEEHPKHFDYMHISYIIKGKEIPVDKVEMAITMSLEKYCGVSYSFRQAMKITHKLVIKE